MKKILLFSLLLPFLSFSQTQIGDDVFGEFANNRFGSSIALSEDGNIMAIGAILNSENGINSGQVQIFENINGTWTQIGDDFNGDLPQAVFGRSVALSHDGNIVAIGADGDDANRGSVRVFENLSGVWTQIGEEIVGQSISSFTGDEVSLSADGNILGVSEPGGEGSVRIFENQAGAWVQIGDALLGTGFLQAYGKGMDLSDDGSIVAIGGPGSSGPGIVQIFENIAGVWTQLGENIIGNSTFERIGSSLSISGDGNIVAISAIGNESVGINTGAVRVYENIGGSWIQQGDDLLGEQLNEFFGATVRISNTGNVLAVGTFGPEYAKVFENVNGSWMEQARIDGDGGVDDFGLNFDLSPNGLTLAIGAPRFDGNGTDAGLTRVYALESIIISSIPNNILSQSIDLFPNPTSDILTVQLENISTLQKVIVYNNIGQILQQYTTNIIDLTPLNSGIYYVKVLTSQGSVTHSVIVN